jgi:hypothetical protein
LVKENLKAKVEWNKESLEECYNIWIHDKVVMLYSGLQCIMISNLGWARNSSIFEDKWFPPRVITTIMLNQVVDFKEDPKSFKQHIPILPTLDYDIPWGYFDGGTLLREELE